MKWTTENKSDYTRPNKYSLPIVKLINLFALVLMVGTMLGQNSIAYLRSSLNTNTVATAAISDEEAIPFDLIRGMIVMNAQVDQTDGQFILDTGAPLMIINDQPEQTTLKATSFKQEVAIGETTIDVFNWAGAEEKKMDALVLDISHLESAFDLPLTGMIGYNALKQYEIFFDYEKQFVLRYRARKNKLHENATPIYSIPFQFYDHLPVITIKIGKRRFRFGLDTGACANLIDQSILEKLSEELYIDSTDEEVQGLDQSVDKVKALIMKHIEVKELAVEDLKFLATDLSQLQSTDGRSIDGLLGYSFLSKMKFSINYPKQRIYIWESE